MRIQLRTVGSFVIRGAALNRAIADAQERASGTYYYDFFGSPSHNRQTAAIVICRG